MTPCQMLTPFCLHQFSGFHTFYLDTICQIFPCPCLISQRTCNSLSAKHINGIQSAGGTDGVFTARTQCNTDSFSVSSPGNPAPPVICGYNTGEHSKIILYVKEDLLCQNHYIEMLITVSVR